MRTTNIGTSAITYPNSVIWVGDNTMISISDDWYPVGLKINITNQSTLKTKELIYISELKNLTLDLSDTIRKLFVSGGTSFNVKVTVYTDGFYTGQFGFNTYCLDGKTLTSRKHGSTRTIYIYSPEELAKVQFLFSGTGGLNVNGHNMPVVGTGRTSFNLKPYIAHAGEYDLCYRYGIKTANVQQAESMQGINRSGDQNKDTTSRVEITNVIPSTFSGVVSLQFSDIDSQPSVDEIKGGGIWKDEKVNLADFCIKLIFENVCDDFNVFQVRYFDTDGCMRYLAGKIDTETVNSKQKNYYHNDGSVYRNISRKKIETASDTVKVKYQDLRRDSYWSDILLAERIDFLNYNGEWMQCSIVTNKVSVNSDESDDVTLEFELWNY